jgi:hypothetical protein
MYKKDFAKNGNAIITKENNVLKIIKNFHLFVFIFIESIFQAIAQTAEYKSKKDAFDASIPNVFTLYSTEDCETIVVIAHNNEEPIITYKYFFTIYFKSGI